MPFDNLAEGLVSRVERARKPEVRLPIVVVASQNGGSGKTTLAGHLAIAADRWGAGTVALVGSDPQGSRSDWPSQPEQETAFLARTASSQRAADLARTRRRGPDETTLPGETGALDDGEA
jgi:Mrp family chromosome partitioning ATPase